MHRNLSNEKKYGRLETLLPPHNPCLTIVLAQLFGEGIEVVEAAVVGGGGDAGDGRHLVEGPGGEDEEGAAGAGIKAGLLGFPVRADGSLLEMDEGVTVLQAEVLDMLLATRDAGGDEDGGSSQYALGEGGAFVLEGLGLLVGDGGSVGGLGIGEHTETRIAVLESLLERELGEACLAVAEDLQAAGPTQEEEVAEGCVVGTADDDVEATLHELRMEAAQDGPAGIVQDIVDHAP